MADNSFTIDLAGKSVKIISMYGYIKEYCKDYITDRVPDYIIETTPDDIKAEREKSARENIKEGLPVYNYTDDYLETLSVYRKAAAHLLNDDVILFHGSVIAVDGQAFLFTAASGTGKSTHTANWRKVFGNRAVIVNDDKPLLKITESGVVAYGTPWDGKHRLSTNICVPLKAICVLKRDSYNHIEKITARDCYPLILQQTYKPAGADLMRKTLGLVDRLSGKTEFYILGCNMEKESALTAWNGMKG